MKNIIYVTGHRNPDSDSIGAAYGYAEFKNKTGDIPAVPVRLGNINRETQYILDTFNVKPLEYLETVKLKVEDLDIDAIEPIAPKTSLKTAWNIMREKNVKSIPVADNNKQLVGILSVSNLTSSYMDNWDSTILEKSNTSIENIIDTLDAKEIYINKEVEKFPGKIKVAAMQPYNMRKRIVEGDIAIVGDRPDVQEALIDINVSLMIITGSNGLSDYLHEKAVKAGATAVMTAFNRLGATWTGGNYQLIQIILRKEWKFKGVVITDWCQGDSDMTVNQGLHAGNDIWLNPANRCNNGGLDENKDSSWVCARRSAHNLLYTICNTFYTAWNAGNDIGVHEGENVFRWWIPVLVLINVIVIGIEGLFLFLLLKKRRILDEKNIVDYSSDIVSINNEIKVLQNAINRYKLDLKTLKKKSKNDNDLKHNFEKLNNEMKLINQSLINISKENNEKEGNEK